MAPKAASDESSEIATSCTRKLPLLGKSWQESPPSNSHCVASIAISSTGHLSSLLRRPRHKHHTAVTVRQTAVKEEAD
eukprot:1561280-Rhodomonas_salina.1